MSDLLSAVNGLTRGREYPLRVDEMLAELSEKERDAVEAALRDPDRVSSSKLETTLGQHGHPVSEGAINTWRDRHLGYHKKGGKPGGSP